MVKHAVFNIFLRTSLKVFLFLCSSAEKSGKRRTEVLLNLRVGYLPASAKILSLSVIQEADQEGSGEVLRNVSACGHSMGPFDHIGRSDIGETQQALKELLSKFRQVVPLIPLR